MRSVDVPRRVGALVTAAEPYGLAITRWEQDHPAWKLSARFESPGWVANRRDSRGRAQVARTLDELSELVKAAEA